MRLAMAYQLVELTGITASERTQDELLAAPIRIAAVDDDRQHARQRVVHAHLELLLFDYLLKRKGA